MGLLDGKVALVSGVGPGMGRDISLQLAEHGADVVLGARTEANVDAVADEVEALGRKAVRAQLDITDETSCQRAVDAGDVGVRPHRHPRQQRVPRRRPSAVREGRVSTRGAPRWTSTSGARCS